MKRSSGITNDGDCMADGVGGDQPNRLVGWPPLMGCAAKWQYLGMPGIGILVSHTYVYVCVCECVCV